MNDHALRLAVRTIGVERRLYSVPESAKDHSPHDAPCPISETFVMPETMGVVEEPPPHRFMAERGGSCKARSQVSSFAKATTEIGESN
ncbi:hypothetical protein [Microvirga pudoricolor]|uniref:hypothetical protein n=1 Tax=Microvirga pudoricolor TaxID=2778729 RepID=UPI00194E43D4|nr:hypothetical protein [Microvirga pudoricolor]MBM6596776.1 hypothetical protein [Microvirga pudoricolor]